MSEHEPLSLKWRIEVKEATLQRDKPRYSHEAHLLFPKVPSPGTFRGLRLLSTEPLPWFEEAVEDLLRHLPPTIPPSTFPSEYITPSFLPVEPHRHDPFGLDGPAGATVTPRERLLLLLLEDIWVGSLSPLLWEEEWPEEKPLFSLPKALSLLRAPGEALDDAAVKRDRLKPGGPLLRSLPHLPPALARLEAHPSLHLLAYLLLPQEEARLAECLALIDRWVLTEGLRQGLQPPSTGKLSPSELTSWQQWEEHTTNSLLRALPWHSNLSPEGLPPALFVRRGTQEDFGLVRTYSLLRSRKKAVTTMLPLPLDVLEALLQVPPALEERARELTERWLPSPPSPEEGILLLLAHDAPHLLSLLEACEEAREGLPASLRALFWRLLVGGHCRAFKVVHLNTSLAGPLSSSLSEEVQRDLLPPLLKAWGSEAFVRLLLEWEPEEVAFTGAAVACLLSHPEWGSLPLSWWWPLLQEEVGTPVPLEY